MPKRRMFSLQIVDADAFLEMPATSQLLYFHLAMRADDDGFVSGPKKIMKMIGAQDDDMKVLLTKRFIIGFESGIVVIKHWKIHNYIAKDRYHVTCYTDEKNRLITKENGSYTDCIQIVDEMDTQVRLGKVSLGKERIGEGIEFTCKYFDITSEQHTGYKQAYPGIDLMSEYYKMVAWLNSNPKKLKKDYPKFVNNWLSNSFKTVKKYPEVPVL